MRLCGIQLPAIRARLKLMLGALVIKEQAYSNPTGEEIAEAIARDQAGGSWIAQWSKAALRLRERLAFMFRHDPEGNGLMFRTKAC